MSWLTGYLGNQPSDDSGAGSRPRRVLPPVNYVEQSDEEDLESGLQFDSPLTSPGRPAQSPSISPRALLIPDPPLIEEVLEAVEKKLSSLPENDDEPVVDTGVVVGAGSVDNGAADVAEEEQVAVPEQPAPAAVVMATPFDVSTAEEDDADIYKKVDAYKYTFNVNDPKYWFSTSSENLK